MKRMIPLIVLAFLASSASGGASIHFEEVAEGLTLPVAITHAGDGSGRLFVLELPGRVRVFKDGEVLERPFLDIAPRVLQDGEGGLIGLAFHPDFRNNRRFFVFYSSMAESGIQSVLAEYRADASDPDVADPEERRLLVFDHPTRIHFGGDLVFGPDGYLYVSSGDGGDPENTEAAQDGGSLLGKVLRIDIDGEPPYDVPPGNPFVGVEGFLPEIWALGFRNPWRMGIDPRSGELYAGDVGTKLWEEVNLVKPGRNYGWPTMEGFECAPMVACDPEDFEPPIFAYDHSENDGVAAVIGGTVYRGGAPALYGGYLASDFVSGRTWEIRDGARGWTAREVGRPRLNLSAYGLDEAGELFAVDLNRGRIYRLLTRFGYGFAQAAAGPYPGGRLVSELALSNPTDQSVDVQLRARSPEGEPLPFQIDGVEGADFQWGLPAGAARRFRLEAESLQAGWLWLESEQEIGATLRILWLNETGDRVASAGLEPSLDVCVYVVRGALDTAAGVSAGVAVANPRERDTVDVVIELLDDDGETVASQEFELDGPRQRAQVLESIAPGLESFSGTVRVRSTRPVLVTAIGTLRGLATDAVRGSGVCEAPPGTVTRGSRPAAEFGKEQQ